MTEAERAEQVLHCRYVDEVVVRSPWVLTQEFMDEYNIDFVVHGEDNSYDESGNDAYAFVKAHGKYKTIKRTDGVSTTDLIIRILKDYNGYVERCMRRGFTYKDLNIPENVWVRQNPTLFELVFLCPILCSLQSQSIASNPSSLLQNELQQHVKVGKKYIS